MAPQQPGVTTDPPQQPGVTPKSPQQPGVTTDQPQPGVEPPHSGLPHPEPLPKIDVTNPNDGYRVVPQALRKNQFAFDNAAHRWGSLRRSLLDLRLSELDLGIIGQVEGIINDYNKALETIDGKAVTGQQHLTSSGNALRSVADAYDGQDRSYYESFGYIGGQLGQVSPPR